MLREMQCGTEDKKKIDAKIAIEDTQGSVTLREYILFYTETI